MTPSQPLVTIITPTFNRAAYLRETIDTVIGQDYENVEHLVLDDGSSDETPELLREYAERAPDRFRWVRHENIGQPATVNRGFEMARGSLLGVVNSDDTLLPGAISRLVHVLGNEPTLVAAYPDFRIVDDKGAAVHTVHQIDYSFREMVRLQECIVGAGAIFRASLVAKIGGWDPSYKMVADYDFWLRAAMVGPMLHVPEVLATWRHHAGAMTVSMRGYEMARERLRLIESFFARADLPEDISSLHNEAFRSVFCICALLVLPNSQRPTDRHAIFDRLTTRVMPDLRPDDLEAAVFWLHNEVAQRDSRIRALEETVDAQIERMARLGSPSVDESPARTDGP